MYIKTKLFEEITLNSGLEVIKPGDPEFGDIIDLFDGMFNGWTFQCANRTMKIEKVEDNPANEGGDASILFDKIFSGDSYIETYFVYNMDNDVLWNASDIAELWDITGDSKNPNTYYALYLKDNHVYVFTYVDRKDRRYLIGALNKEEFDDIMSKLPEDKDLEQFIQENDDAFKKVFEKSSVGL